MEKGEDSPIKRLEALQQSGYTTKIRHCGECYLSYHLDEYLDTFQVPFDRKRTGRRQIIGYLVGDVVAVYENENDSVKQYKRKGEDTIDYKLFVLLITISKSLNDNSEE
jgi:hypothetical protein